MRLATPMITPDDVSFVKSQADFHRRTCEKFSGDPVRGKRHLSIASQFDDLAARLERSMATAEKKPSSTKAVAPGQLRIGNLDDLPPELRKQIKISESDQLEMDIVAVIQSFEGEAAVDEILVGLWKKTGKVEDRDFLARKLYRMTRAKIIGSVPRRKGYFSTELNEEDDNEDVPEDDDRDIFK